MPLASFSGEASEPFSTTAVEGTFNAPGIWPERTPARGSGARPTKRSAGRASTTCADLLSSADRTASREATMSAGLRDFEPAWRTLGSPDFDRPLFCLPLRKSAVEDEHVLGAEQAKSPPHPRRGKQARTVIDDDGIAIGDAERAHLARELLVVRQHMRQRVGMVGNRIDVEAHRARECGRRDIRPRHRVSSPADRTSHPRPQSSGVPRRSASQAVVTSQREVGLSFGMTVLTIGRNGPRP